MAMDFPAAPTVGQLYPATPVAGIPQYKWDGTAWVAVLATEMQNYVQRAGDTMTGPLVLPADPTLNLQASTKQYVDGRIVAAAVRYDAVQALTAAQQQQARQNIGSPVPNLIINGDFRINQGGYVSAAALSAPAYGHDQWKAGASGGDYSFTQLKSSTQITIASGKSLIQPIEDVNVAGGSYVLSWTGTAQARAGINTLTPSGAYAASPLLISGQTAGTAMSVEFNTGTLGTVKLESGANATPFVMRPYDQELLMCKRYWEILDLNMIAYTVAGVGTAGSNGYFSVEKRATPTTISFGNTSTNWGLRSIFPNTRGAFAYGDVTTTGTFQMQISFKCDARL